MSQFPHLKALLFKNFETDITNSLIYLQNISLLKFSIHFFQERYRGSLATTIHTDRKFNFDPEWKTWKVY